MQRAIGDAFHRASPKRHNTVGSGNAASETALPSSSPRRALERPLVQLPPGERQSAERGSGALGALSHGEGWRTRSHLGEKSALLDGYDPRWQRRPALRLERESPRTDPPPRLAERQPLHSVQTQRQPDRRGRVVAAGGEALREYRRQPAAQTTAVASNPERPDLWDASGVSRTAHLARAQPMAHEHQGCPHRSARRAAPTAAPRPSGLDARNNLRPFLDVDCRIDDSCTALSAHCDRAQREAVTPNQSPLVTYFVADSASLLAPPQLPLHQRARIGPIYVHAGKAASHPAFPITLRAR